MGKAKASRHPCPVHHNMLLEPQQNCPKCIQLRRNKEKRQKKKKGPRVYDKQSWRGPRGIRQQKLNINPLCEDCEERGLIVQGDHVDHIDGDAHNMEFSNLRTLCVPCHSRKTVAQDGGFGQQSKREK